MAIRLFLICPVRGCSDIETEAIASYVAHREQRGAVVYWPARDTDQADAVGLAICMANRQAIEKADEVHVWWSDTSQGSLFDLGMAFAFGKPVVLANPVAATPAKSFANMLRALASQPAASPPPAAEEPAIRFQPLPKTPDRWARACKETVEIAGRVTQGADLSIEISDTLMRFVAHDVCPCVCHEFPDHQRLQALVERWRTHADELRAAPVSITSQAAIGWLSQCADELVAVLRALGEEGER